MKRSPKCGKTQFSFVGNNLLSNSTLIVLRSIFAAVPVGNLGGGGGMKPSCYLWTNWCTNMKLSFADGATYEISSRDAVGLVAGKVYARNRFWYREALVNGADDRWYNFEAGLVWNNVVCLLHIVSVIYDAGQRNFVVMAGQVVSMKEKTINFFVKVSARLFIKEISTRSFESYWG